MRFLNFGRAVLIAASLPAAVVLAQQTVDAPASQPPVTFRVDVDYVEVDAVVTDEQGNFLRDLRMSDFQIFEDGQPQDVTVFALVDIPIERSDRPLFADRSIEPDVRSNRQPFDGRLYVLLLDDLHTSPQLAVRVRLAAQRFIERHFGANDLAAVLFTSGRSEGAQDFTNSRRLLTAAVERFKGLKIRSGTAERLDRYTALRDTPRVGAVNDIADGERGYNARNALLTVKNVADWLNGIYGRRKAVLFMSEGIDYNIYDSFSSPYASVIVTDAQDTIAAATRSNVNIYTINPRGLAQLGGGGGETQAFPFDPTLNIGLSSIQEEHRLAQDSLRTLADETGGFATLNTNNFTQALSRIVRENSVYYVLGYYPTNTERDGKVRKIDVRVSRPDVEVRARKAYVAPSGRSSESAVAESSDGTSAALREALDAPLPVSDLPIDVAAAAFKGEAPRASVAVVIELDGTALTFSEREGIYSDRLEVVVMPLNSKGEPENVDRVAADMKLKPETYEAVSRGGVRLMSRLDLHPGRYQLRIGALEEGGGATGSLYYDLEVPDFSKEAFVMSGLMITSASAGRIPTIRADSELKDILPAPPTTTREFRPDDTLALFTEVYDNQAETPHSVDITTTVRGNDGGVVFSDRQERSTKELQGARGGFGHTVEIPLRGVQPGAYVLRVEARSSLSGGLTAAQETRIQVR